MQSFIKVHIFIHKGKFYKLETRFLKYYLRQMFPVIFKILFFKVFRNKKIHTFEWTVRYNALKDELFNIERKILQCIN